MMSFNDHNFQPFFYLFNPWVWSKPVGDTQKIFPPPFVLASPPQLQPTTFDHTLDLSTKYSPCTIITDFFLRKWKSCVPQLLAHTVKICIPQPLASRYKISLLDMRLDFVDLPGINDFYSYIPLGCYGVQSEITKFISYIRYHYNYIWCTSLLREPQYYRVGYYGYENSYEIGFWIRNFSYCFGGVKLFGGLKH